MSSKGGGESIIHFDKEQHHRHCEQGVQYLASQPNDIDNSRGVKKKNQKRVTYNATKVRCCMTQHTFQNRNITQVVMEVLGHRNLQNINFSHCTNTQLISDKPKLHIAFAIYTEHFFGGMASSLAIRQRCREQSS
jgi:hypothetical protein